MAVSGERDDDADVIGDSRVTALDALMILQAVSYHNLTEQRPSNHTYGVVKTHNPGDAS